MVSQQVLVSSTIWGPWPDIYYCLTVTVFTQLRTTSPRYTAPARNKKNSLFHYCVFFRFRGNVSTGLSLSNGCCTVACLHSCYLATGLRVTISTPLLLRAYMVYETTNLALCNDDVLTIKPPCQSRCGNCSLLSVRPTFQLYTLYGMVHPPHTLTSSLGILPRLSSGSWILNPRGTRVMARF
jgi:hypothetical protein